MAVERTIKEYNDYSEWIKFMEADGWVREAITIGENNTTLVNTFAVATGATAATRVIEITAPAGRILSFMGSEQVPAGADRQTAHFLILRLAGTDETEMDRIRKLIITKLQPSGAVIPVDEVFYSHVSLTRQGGTTITRVDKSDVEIFRWRRGIVLYGNEILRIAVVGNDIAIAVANIRLSATGDLWTKRM